MSKLKISAFGSPFSHDVTSCHGNTPTNFSWIYNESSDIEVYMDYNFLGGMESNSPNKFLWMAESKEYFLSQYDFLKINADKLTEIYKKIFTHDTELLKSHSIFEYCPPGSNKSWITAGKIYSKTKLASMICSGVNITKGHKHRNNLLINFKQNNLLIDYYGRNINAFSKKEEALSEYCFSIVVENGKYSNYYTEKIMDCFAVGTIPIYWGSPDIGNMFDLNGIIILDETFDFSSLTFELYHSKIKYINNNFLKEKYHTIADDYLFNKIIQFI